MSDGLNAMEPFASWAKYLYWAELSFLRLEELKQQPAEVFEKVFLDHVSLWLGNLWVVVEGWQELKYSSPSIDQILESQPEFCGLLKRHRNGVFHFQKKHFGSRFTDLYARGAYYYWSYCLHYEFKRYLWNWASHKGGTAAQHQEIREILRRTIGWFPDDIIEAKRFSLARTIAEGRAALASGSAEGRASEEGMDLAATITSIEKLLEKTPATSMHEVLKKAGLLDQSN